MTRSTVAGVSDHPLRASNAGTDYGMVTTNQTENLSFGQALEALKLGNKIQRNGWNSKGMYIWLLPAFSVPAAWCKEPHLKSLAEENGGEIECLGSIRMYTTNAAGRRAVLTGWLASQTDMLSNDWRIL